MKKPMKLNPDYYKWAIEGKSNDVNKLYARVRELSNIIQAVWWDKEGKMCVYDTTQARKELENVNIMFKSAVEELESLKEKAKDFHPDDLYTTTDTGELVRVERGGKTDE